MDKAGYTKNVVRRNSELLKVAPELLAFAEKPVDAGPVPSPSPGFDSKAVPEPDPDEVEAADEEVAAIAAKAGVDADERFGVATSQMTAVARAADPCKPSPTSPRGVLHDILDDVFDLVLRTKEDVASSVVDMSQDGMLDGESLVGSILFDCLGDVYVDTLVQPASPTPGARRSDPAVVGRSVAIEAKSPEGGE